MIWSRFEIANLIPGGSTTITLQLPDGERPKKYFKYGPTPDNNDDHWYDFTFDGETGAEIDGNLITIHFVDGKRGDSDLAGNGIIVDTGSPALNAGNAGVSGGGGGGGCSLAYGRHSRSAQAGAWYLLLMLWFAGTVCLARRQRG